MGSSVDKISLDEKYSFTAKAKRNIIILISVGLILSVIGALMVKSGIGVEHHGHATEAKSEKNNSAEGNVEQKVAESEESQKQSEEKIEMANASKAEGKEQHADHGHGHGPAVWVKRIIKNLWHNNVFFLGIAIIGVFFVAFNYVAQAGWGTLIKRIPEAFGYYLPVGAILTIILILIGGHTLFHWMDSSLYDKTSPHYDEILDSKTWWLNIPFFWARTIVFLAAWIGLWALLRKFSVQEDIEGGDKFFHKSNYWSATFLVVFGLSSSMLAWDWVMSMDPHFFSTMFGWYVFASWFVSGLATITLVIILLKEAGYLKMVNENHLHDMGKFMFAFSIFWTYIWFEQFLLIYYSNIPEEAFWFIERMRNWTYKPLWFTTFWLNFFFPFLALMTRESKRQSMILKIVACVIIFGHWLDFYVMITPPVLHNDGGLDFNWFFLELGIVMIFIGIFAYAILTGLSKAGLIPKKHPMIEESIYHHVY